MPGRTHIPTIAAELGFSCNYAHGKYTLERGGVILRISRRGHGLVELRLKGTLQKADLPSLATGLRLTSWLRKLNKETACDAIRAAKRHELKVAQKRVSSAMRDLDELEEEIKLWWGKDWV